MVDLMVTEPNLSQGQALTRKDSCSVQDEQIIIQVSQSLGKRWSRIGDVFVLRLRLVAEVFRATQTKHTASRALITRFHRNLNTGFATVCR